MTIWQFWQLLIISREKNPVKNIPTLNSGIHILYQVLSAENEFTSEMSLGLYTVKKNQIQY